MNLEDTLAGVALKGDLPSGLARAAVLGLDYDSRRIAPQSLFFAFPGTRTDGRHHAAEAMARGALAVVSELPPPAGFRGPWIEVEHGRRALALAARNWYAARAALPAITGITGTNGKTTTSYLHDSVLRAAGYRTALIGTIEYHVAGEVLPAVNTTPESLDLYRMFATLRERGGSHATIEASSHALALGRVWGLRFAAAVFTNFSRDHLDLHGTLENYFAAKRELFLGQDAPPPPLAVVNADDEWAARLAPPAGVRLIAYGISRPADVRAANVVSTSTGLRLDIQWEGRSYPVVSPLVGHINVYNLLAAFAGAAGQGIPPAVAARGLAACPPVPGRFERIEAGQPFLVIVDYAHTDDALRNALRVARSLAPKRILTLFGCGGDRDRAKRPLMGMAAGEGSDYVALTSDNPRSEDPLAIINDALVGLRRYDVPHLVEPDREAAMRRLLGAAQPGDLVLIAGKGHEPYQTLKDRTIPFDDREVARRLLRGLGYGRKDR